MKLRFLDVVALCLSACAVVAFSIPAYSRKTAAREVIVEASNQKWIFPLQGNRVERFTGPLGQTVVEIRDGRARIVDSPCPDKLCVRAAPISKPGQWIACLPNKVFVRIGCDGGEMRKGSQYVEPVDDTSY